MAIRIALHFEELECVNCLVVSVECSLFEAAGQFFRIIPILYCTVECRDVEYFRLGQLVQAIIRCVGPVNWIASGWIPVSLL